MKKYICLITALLLAPLNAGAYVNLDRPMPHWVILPEKSYIHWAIKYSGQTIHGSFPDFSAYIKYDELRGLFGHSEVKISTGKVTSDDKDAQDYLPTSDWLGPDVFPLATLVASQKDSFTHVQGEHYILDGEFTLHGYRGHLSIPFTMHIVTDKSTWTPTNYAIVDGQTIIRRLDYKIGQGDWARTDALSGDVTVTFHLEAKEVASDE